MHVFFRNINERSGAFFHSVRFRLTLWYLLILTIVLVLFCGFVYTRQAGDLRATALNRLMYKSRQLDGYYHASGPSAPGSSIVAFPDISSSGTALIQENEALALVDTQGEIIQIIGPIDKTDFTQIFTATNQTSPGTGTFVYSLRSSATNNDLSNQDYYFAATPIDVFHQIVGFFILGVPIDPGGELPRLLVTLILASLGTLTLAMVGGYWLAGRAMRPVQIITHAARDMSETDLSRRLNLKTKDELGELADTFDAMLARLQAAFERQQQFTADASHELRTPLTIVNLEASRALSNRRTPQEYERALNVIQSENEFMARLVNNLLTLARMDAGQASLKMEDGDLGDITLEVFERLAPLAARQEVELIPGELPDTPIHGDQQYIQQMVANLVENAIKYCQAEHKQVIVETGIRDDQAWVRVEDNGPGIPQEFIPHLFDRFSRLDKARTRNTNDENTGKETYDQSGTGLGLSIVKWIAESHGGKVSVVSEMGKGSIFEVSLPLRT